MASFVVVQGTPDRVKPLPEDRESFKIGLVVQLFGLSKADLNDKIAEIIGPPTKDSEGNLRYQAMVVDTEFKGNFKAANMREVPAPSPEAVEECLEIFKEVHEIEQQESKSPDACLPGGRPAGATAKAFLLLERAKSLWPQSSWVHVHLSGIAQMSGIVGEELIHYYRKGIANLQYPDPIEGTFESNYEKLLANLATALGSAGKFDEEREILLSLQALDDYANCDGIALDIGINHFDRVPKNIDRHLLPEEIENIKIFPVVNMRMDPNLIVGIKDGMIYATPVKDYAQGHFKIDGDLVLGVMELDEKVKEEIEAGDDSNLKITGEG